MNQPLFDPWEVVMALALTIPWVILTLLEKWRERRARKAAEKFTNQRKGVPQP